MPLHCSMTTSSRPSLLLASTKDTSSNLRLTGQEIQSTKVCNNTRLATRTTCTLDTIKACNSSQQMASKMDIQTALSLNKLALSHSRTHNQFNLNRRLTILMDKVRLLSRPSNLSHSSQLILITHGPTTIKLRPSSQRRLALIIHLLHPLVALKLLSRQLSQLLPHFRSRRLLLSIMRLRTTPSHYSHHRLKKWILTKLDLMPFLRRVKEWIPLETLVTCVFRPSTRHQELLSTVLDQV
jgi:hypothetical protein